MIYMHVFLRKLWEVWDYSNKEIMDHLVLM